MSEQVSGQSVVTTPGDRDIHVERIFDAPRERVYRAYTDPEQLSQWWGPHGTTTTVEELEIEPGGRWQVLCVSEGGSEDRFRGVYREAVEPERISWTFEWMGMPGHASVETVEFEDLGDGRTKATSTTYFYLPEERDGMLEAGMESGMNESFEKLDQLLASQG